MDEVSLSIASGVRAVAKKLLWSELTSLQSMAGAVRWFMFLRIFLQRESRSSWILFAVVSLSSVSRRWFSSDVNCDRR